MNFELVKQAIALYNQLEKENGFISLSSNSCHVQPYLLKGMENLSVTSRNDKDFPFKITAEMDGVKYFALATTKEIAEFPQCKEDVRAELLKQLAALDDKNEGELV